MPKQILTIAGSDSSGGAGIQADLKTFSALGAYGASVITAVTAQNTCGVSAVHALPVDIVIAQLDAVFSDLQIDAVKLGMLANAEIVCAVAASLRRWRPPVVVLDTVMIAKNGHALLAPEAVEALRRELLPLADLITPNLSEAAVLLNLPIAHDEASMRQQGERLRALGARAVLMKGGHLAVPESPDWLLEADGAIRVSAVRQAGHNTHGTGCTLSAALAALYPQHRAWPPTLAQSKLYLNGALAAADQLHIGQGIGPVHHFHAWWPATA